MKEGIVEEEYGGSKGEKKYEYRIGFESLCGRRGGESENGGECYIIEGFIC